MDWLSVAIDQRRSFVFGDVSVAFRDDHAVISGQPRPGTDAVELVAGPDQLRTFLRIDDAGSYRSMASARGLRSGWTLRVPIAELADHLDAIYPLAAVHIRTADAGALRVVPLDEVLRRQSGRYEVVAHATAEQRSAVVRALCSKCVREPAWLGAAVTPSAIPCPEACSIFVALCREVVVDPAGVDIGPARETGTQPAFAAFDDPANSTVAFARSLLSG